MAADRYRSPGSSRGSSRKRRRHHYENSHGSEKYDDLDNRSSISSNSSSGGSSTYVPAPALTSSIASATRPQHTQDHSQRDDASRSSSRSQSSSSRPHRKYLRSHHRHNRKTLPAPDEEDEKTAFPTTVAIREEYPVQTVSRSRQRRDLSPEEEEEEVHDHRPRPLSRRNGNRHPERRTAQGEPSQKSNTTDQGFFMAAVMVVVSLFICIGEAD